MRRKLMLLVAAGLFLGATGAYAHLTGAFANFLVTVNDESTTERLKAEVAQTKKEIARLAPQIAKLEKSYVADQKVAVDKLQFYSEMGLDTWVSLLQQQQEPVDILGSQWLIERNLDAYMEELDKLYLAYKQLVATKETLEGHEKLLGMIEQNLQARGAFLADNPELPIEQLANYLDIDWMAEVEPALLAILAKDRALTEQQAATWASTQTGTASQPYRLDESWINERSELRYFFRSDHVYVVFQKPDLHVILIGQVLKDSSDAAALVFEAGFFNGFLMPETLIEELQGFRIPYAQLLQLPRVQAPFYLQQTSGGLIVRTGDSQN
ncbi:hypothetical protein [Brevibacillus parabrevis]|uniref:hypothetical protein n=1 Tax=Brevibacillus parabrevis TaxID=54914 RepID=UPI0023806305|nr:hypothetical protein [Brevibacillus parabrevis]WDV95272.1 hypothetical protein PSE45_27160 [Brevibacillus parabrevis]